MAALSDLLVPGVEIKATDGSRKMLALLLAAGMTKVQIEQLGLSMLNNNWRAQKPPGRLLPSFSTNQGPRGCRREEPGSELEHLGRSCLCGGEGGGWLH